MEHDVNDTRPTSPYTQAIAFAVALVFYWPLFTLLVFPPELFPDIGLNTAASDQSGMLAAALACCAILTVWLGRDNRPNTILALAQRREILAILLVSFTGLILLLLSFQIAGTPVPNVLFWLYPVVLGVYAFSLSVHITLRAEAYSLQMLAVIVTASLLVSFLVGITIPLISGALGLTQSNSSFLMLMISGVVVLFASPTPSKDVLKTQMTFPKITPSLRLPLILLDYLLGSGIILNMHWAPANGLWSFDGWIHCVLGFALYSFFFAYAFVKRNSSADPYPWVLFLLLSIGSLYCTALFYSTLASACVEIILPSRPLAMALVWATVVTWASATSKSAPKAVVIIVLPGIFGIDLLSSLIGRLLALFPDADFAMRAIVLATAFAVTVGMVLWIGFRNSTLEKDRIGASTQIPPETASIAADPTLTGNEAAILTLSVKYNLSSREIEVMTLIAEGHTQKKIAELMIISINSVRTYAKNLYAKLGVHSRQELIDLVNETRDRTAQ